MEDASSLFEQISSLCRGDESSQLLIRDANNDDEDSMIGAVELMQFTLEGDGQTSCTNSMSTNASVPCARSGVATSRTSDDGRVACPFCGCQALLLGGSTRGEQYTYICHKGCQQRWNQRRVPNAVGDYEISLSKRAIGNEARRSGGYKCGVCGVKPKSGHICLGSKTKQLSLTNSPLKSSLTPQLNSVHDASINDAEVALQTANKHMAAILPITNTPVRPAVASVLQSHCALEERSASALPMPMPMSTTMSTTTAETHAKTSVVVTAVVRAAEEMDTGDDDMVTEDTEEATTGDAKLSLGKQRVVDGRDEIVAWREVVHKGEECKGMELRWVTETPAVFDEVQKLKRAWEDDTEDEDEDMEENGAATAKADESAVPFLTDETPFDADLMYASLGLRRMSVKGDGSCWVYAILMCVGLLQHGSTDEYTDPTPRDRGMDAMCRIMVHVFLKENVSLSLSSADALTIDAILRCPDYPLLHEDDYGEFGSTLCILALCHYFKITCVIWNKKTIHVSQAYQQVVYYDSETDEVCEQLWNYDIVYQTQCSATQAPIVHIEWNGVDHYAALIGNVPAIMDLGVRAQLCSVPLVVRQKPVLQRMALRRPIEATRQALPMGWSELPNRIRNDAARTKLVTKEKTRDEHLFHALHSNYNAVLMINNNDEAPTEIRYLDYDFEVDELNSVAAGDFSCVLYVYASATRRTLPPDVDPLASCICGKFYIGRNSQMECTLCGRWCHVSCVLGAVDDAVAEKAANEFECGVCDAP
tara:strand:+ start:71 stop:2353 length:2283 start_codon:yes stop_codon:yes gene_type:complete